MWLRLEGNHPQHAKFRGISSRAYHLWSWGLAHAGQHLTDGYLAPSVVRALQKEIDGSQGLLEGADPVAELVERGLWEPVPELSRRDIRPTNVPAGQSWDKIPPPRPAQTAYMIHGYLDYNPTRKSVLSRQKRERLRKKNWRQARQRAAHSAGGVPRMSRRDNPVPSASRDAHVPSLYVPSRISPPKNSIARNEDLPVVERHGEFSSSLRSVGRSPLAANGPQVTLVGTTFVVPPDLLTAWTAAYPAVDVSTAVRQAAAWAVANPANRKRNWQRFLVNWLAREQEHAPRRNSAAVPPGETMQERAVRYRESLERLERQKQDAKGEMP